MPENAGPLASRTVCLPPLLSLFGLSVPALLSPSLITKSSVFGIGIAFSPLHIAVVTLLLLGRSPLQRAMAYVAGWAAANALAIVVLMVLGEAFSISLSHGERDRS